MNQLSVLTSKKSLFEALGLQQLDSMLVSRPCASQTSTSQTSTKLARSKGVKACEFQLHEAASANHENALRSLRHKRVSEAQQCYLVVVVCSSSRLRIHFLLRKGTKTLTHLLCTKSKSYKKIWKPNPSTESVNLLGNSRTALEVRANQVSVGWDAKPQAHHCLNVAATLRRKSSCTGLLHLRSHGWLSHRPQHSTQGIDFRLGFGPHAQLCTGVWAIVPHSPGNLQHIMDQTHRLAINACMGPAWPALTSPAHFQTARAAKPT